MEAKMREATLLVVNEAKQRAPVDTGRLRASITPEVRREDGGVVGIVGSNVVYAPYMELGTRPHWPPPGALAVWARRHHIPEYVVRRAIGLRGLEARRFLQGAFEAMQGRIKDLIGRAVGEIVRR
jgi:phage gpG-like protein